MKNFYYIIIVWFLVYVSGGGSAYSAEIGTAIDEIQKSSAALKLAQAIDNDQENREADTSTKASKSRDDEPTKAAKSRDDEPAKAAKSRDDEPAKAVIPTQRKRKTFSKREKRFAEIKRSLQGPEGLLHLSSLETFMERYPDHLQARLWLIRSQLMSQQFDNALNSIGEPGKWQDPDWQVSYWKAQVHLHHGQHGLARRAMDYAVSRKSDNADIWVQQAVLEQEANNHSGAVQLLQIALEVEPSNAVAQLNLGFSLEHLSQHQAALRAYRSYLSNANASNSTMRLKVLRQLELLASYNSQNTLDNATTNLSIK